MTMFLDSSETNNFNTNLYSFSSSMTSKVCAKTLPNRVIVPLWRGQCINEWYWSSATTAHNEDGDSPARLPTQILHSEDELFKTTNSLVNVFVRLTKINVLYLIRRGSTLWIIYATLIARSLILLIRFLHHRIKLELAIQSLIIVLVVSGFWSSVKVQVLEWLARIN